MDCFVSPCGLPRKDGKGVEGKRVIIARFWRFVWNLVNAVIARLDKIKSWQSIHLSSLRSILKKRCGNPFCIKSR